MLRKIVKFDNDKCNGCGLCARACHEGAIEIKNGKAALIREDFCDAMGSCLPACPQGAISFEEREAPEYDRLAVLKAHTDKITLRQWPVQIKLVPVTAPFFENRDILIAADCTAFACKKFHEDIAAGKTVLVGCSKLDDTDYSEKLREIFKYNNIRSVTVARMTVPCCGGMVRFAEKALEASGKDVPFNVITISTDGSIIDE